jgi:tryptophan synthase alpha chain
MTRLAPYLMINYPSPEIFKETFLEVLEINPEYIEIQIPFSNPIADGSTLWNANQEAIEFDLDVFEILQWISHQKLSKNSSSKLILMSYLPKIYYLGISRIAHKLVELGFEGLLIPDLPFGTIEQKTISDIFDNSHTSLIPLIAPNTDFTRQLFIKSFLKPNQFVYFVARVGITGNTTDFDNDFGNYLKKIKENFGEFEIGIGFGINTKEQVTSLNNSGFIAIVASSIIKKLGISKQDAIEYIKELNN